MLDRHPPVPHITKRDRSVSGKYISLSIFNYYEDWSRSRYPIKVSINAEDFCEEELHLIAVLGGGETSGVWVTLQNGTVVFYCNLWQVAEGNCKLIRTLDVISPSNPIEGNYYLDGADPNDITSFVNMENKRLRKEGY